MISASLCDVSCGMRYWRNAGGNKFISKYIVFHSENKRNWDSALHKWFAVAKCCMCMYMSAIFLSVTYVSFSSSIKRMAKSLILLKQQCATPRSATLSDVSSTKNRSTGHSIENGTNSYRVNLLKKHQSTFEPVDKQTYVLLCTYT